jgi:hypothetical protein
MRRAQGWGARLRRVGRSAISPQALIENLTKRGAKITLPTCGPKKRLCVLVEDAEGGFGDRKRGETHMIAKGD